ncbi:MAG: hypothetical protein ACXVXR_13800, partial [Blastococcus sp.]
MDVYRPGGASRDCMGRDNAFWRSTRELAGHPQAHWAVDVGYVRRMTIGQGNPDPRMIAFVAENRWGVLATIK